MGITEEIRKELLYHQDPAYREFQIGLIPTVRPETVIGVRTPVLRKMAKELGKREDLFRFLADLPHGLFEENQLHAFIISDIKDFAVCLERVNQFLPQVDNWATCDQLSPKCFGKHRTELMDSIGCWIHSEETYTVRFGIRMLMNHYLGENFDPVYPEWVSELRSEEYYVNMMIAWYFATALAKQYDVVLPLLREHRLAPWTHNMAIRKAIESYRVTPEQKMYLKSLKIAG